MFLIKDNAYRYNRRVEKVIDKEIDLGLFKPSNDIVIMVKEMIGCMFEMFDHKYEIEIDPEGNSFSSCFEICDSIESVGNVALYPGLGKISLNLSEIESMKDKFDQIANVDEMYSEMNFKSTENNKKSFKECLLQYALMHIVYHEYGHIKNGHTRALSEKNLTISNESNPYVRKALEYNADLFAVNQMCRRFIADNIFEHSFRDSRSDAFHDNMDLLLEEVPIMSLAVHAQLDGTYDLQGKYDVEDHPAYYIRQWYIMQQFAGIWYCWGIIDKEENDILCKKIADVINGYEMICNKRDFIEMPFLKAKDLPEITMIQEEWNRIYLTLKQFDDIGVELTGTLVFDLSSREYFEYEP